MSELKSLFISSESFLMASRAVQSMWSLETGLAILFISSLSMRASVSLGCAFRISAGLGRSSSCDELSPKLVTPIPNFELSLRYASARASS